MSRTLRDVGQLVAGNPHYGNGEFWCMFELRSTYAMRPKDVAVATEAAMGLFQQQLHMNKLTEYAWPPTRIEVDPHSDFRGLRLTLGTQAREPSIVANLNPLGIHEAPAGLQ